MIRSVSGKLSRKQPGFAVIDAGPVSFKIFVSSATFERLPQVGAVVRLATYLHVRENALELYGFLHEAELDLFERLNTVSGIGPKSALGIMSIARVEQLIAAINEGRPELLTRASGIGRKTAERAILELKGKLSALKTPETLRLMESDLELEETLISLGFSRSDAKSAIEKVDPATAGFPERLREALRKGKQHR
ncbi:MAG: Holliday junction branch migration protein RuvA [Patescibacteria group bacterium]